MSLQLSRKEYHSHLEKFYSFRLEGGQTRMHSTHPRQMNAESVRKSRGKPDRTRILPSSTADVQAAIAAIQARSAAMRRQTAQTMSSLNNPDSRGERLTHQTHNDNTREGISTNNSTFDSDDSSNHAGQQYFTDIGAVIDHVNGKKKERELSASGEQKDEVDKDTISLSDSDVSSDSDDSLIAEGMVSNATQMNIGAFIDSLNAANKHSDHNGTPNVPDNAAPLAKSVSLDDSVHSTEGKDKYKISDEIAEEIVYDKEILGTYIKKADALAKSESPKVSDLEYVIFYARRDKVPIMPVLDTFDEGMVNREGFAVSRLSHFIRETILLIESKEINARKQSQLLDDISAENFDISMFKSMLKNPKKHVRFVEELEDLDIANISDKSGDSEEDDDDKENEDGQSHDEIEGGETQDVNVKPKVDTNRIYFENKMRQLAAAEKRYCREDLSRVPDVDGVASTRRIFTKRLFKRHPTLTPFRINTWKLSKAQRSNLHKGYTGVDSKTILSLAVQTDIPSTNEAFEWENLEMEMTKASDLIENTDFFGTTQI